MVDHNQIHYPSDSIVKGSTTGTVIARAGTAHGRSEDLACSPLEPEAYRRGILCLIEFVEMDWKREGVLRVAVRNILRIGGGIE